jgi:hypothetical protein
MLDVESASMDKVPDQLRSKTAEEREPDEFSREQISSRIPMIYMAQLDNIARAAVFL